MSKLPITSAASLKRAILIPGVLIRVVEHWQPNLRESIRTPKQVRNGGKPGIQTNGYYFDGRKLDGTIAEMWAEIPAASKLRFNENGTVTFHPDTDRSWTLEFSLPEAALAA